MPDFQKWLGIEMVEVSVREKLIAMFGGGLAILGVLGITVGALPQTEGLAVIASMGASAVLLFAVPHGQLSQPWPVIGGHTLSAVIGVACARWIPHPLLAVACTVGLAIGVMHHFKCIHPPGAATGVTAVIGSQAVHDLGFRFALLPVFLSTLLMVGLAILLNLAFHWRRYPAAFNRALHPPLHVPIKRSPTHEDVLAAIKSFDSFMDITEEDLLRLVELLDRRREEATELTPPFQSAPPCKYATRSHHS